MTSGSTTVAFTGGHAGPVRPAVSMAAGVQHDVLPRADADQHTWLICSDQDRVLGWSAAGELADPRGAHWWLCK